MQDLIRHPEHQAFLKTLDSGFEAVSQSMAVILSRCYFYNGARGGTRTPTAIATGS
jgi:hypothetical protein